jgi:hypothetical protein
VRSAAPTTNGSPSASLPTALPATVEPGPIEPRVEVRLEVPGEAVPTRVDGLTDARQISANGDEDLTAAEQSGGEVIVA